MTSTDTNISWAERPLRELLRLAWPIAVSMVSFSAMSVVDTLFVGRISAAAIAGVGLGSLLVFTLACFGIGLLRAVKTLTAQSVGAGNRAEAWRFLGAGLTWAGILGGVSLAIGLLVLSFTPTLAGSADAAREAHTYLNIRLWALPILSGYVALREFCYGAGNARAPMVATILANVVNALLDYAFIFVFELGVAGAAWASLAAQFVELGLLWWALLPPRSALRPSRAALGEVWRLGVPTGTQFLVEVGSFTLTGLLIARMSEVQMAAHQIAIQILHFSFLPAHAIGEAASVLVGQVVGAGRFHLVPRVARMTLGVVSSYMTLFTFLLLIAATFVGGWFTDDLRVSSLVGVLLLFAVSFQLVDGAAIVGGAVLRGVGDVRFVAVSSVLVAWAFTPTSTYFVGVLAGWGALGAWCGIALEMAVISLLCWSRLGGRRWQVAAERTREAVL